MTSDVAQTGKEGSPAWEIDVFRPEDAAGVAELYRQVYGENYPVRDVYDPQKLIGQSLTGEAYRVVARGGAGEVLGHIAFYRSSPPNRNMYELGQMMVRQDCRVGDMAGQLFAFSLAEVPKRHNLEQVWGEAVCNHLVTQQMAADCGFLPAALEVGLMPAGAFAAAFAQTLGTGRVATLALFRAFRARPQTLFLPPVYEDALRSIYEPFGFGHTFAALGRELPADTATGGRTDFFAPAGVARITLSAAGRDFASYMEEAERQAAAGGAVVIQIFFPLTWPWAGAAADILRRQGYFLGGALPRWFDDDGLLMQKMLIDPDFDGIHLFRKQAKKILDLVKQDWLSVRSGA
jgi:hypothetical protein